MWVAEADKRVLDLLNGGESVLDFGCGNGGYYDSLSKKYDQVNLYDVPFHVAEIDQNILNSANVFSSWDDIKDKQFTDILASLVFQHMSPDDLNEKLLQMSKMITGHLIVKSRYHFNPYICQMLDFKGINVLEYIDNHFILVSLEKVQEDQFFVAKFAPRV